MKNLKKLTPMSPELAHRIFELAEKHHGSRIASFFKLSYLTGLRTNELLNQKFSDISLINNTLLTSSNKFGHDGKYSFHLTNEAIPVINKLRDNFPSDIYLFQSKKSNNRINAEPSPLSRQYLCQVIKEINEITRKKITMNQFRQEFIYKNLRFK